MFNNFCINSYNCNKQIVKQYFQFYNKAPHKAWRERLRNAEVTVAMTEEEIEFTGANPEVLCYYHDGILNQYYTLATCKQPIRGRFVQILFNAKIYINIYEVEVHGI